MTGSFPETVIHMYIEIAVCVENFDLPQPVPESEGRWGRFGGGRGVCRDNPYRRAQKLRLIDT